MCCPGLPFSFLLQEPRETTYLMVLCSQCRQSDMGKSLGTRIMVAAILQSATATLNLALDTKERAQREVRD